MCSRIWFVTDRRIHQEYPQVQILRALKDRCAEEDVEFRSLLMDQIVLTISQGQLGKYAQKNRAHLCFPPLNLRGSAEGEKKERML